MRRVVFMLLLGVSLAASFFAGTVWAEKPKVPTEEMVKKSAVVLSAEVESVLEIAKPAKDANGQWSQQRQRVSFKPGAVLKADLSALTECDEGSLAFEKGKSYLFFLEAKAVTVEAPGGKRRALVFDFVDPAQRLEATEENLAAVKKAVAK